MILRLGTSKWSLQSSNAQGVRDRLSAFKVPTLWLVAASPDAVPMSATGKVDKKALQHLLRAQGVRCAVPTTRS